jgi:hypothetical protein
MEMGVISSPAANMKEGPTVRLQKVRAIGTDLGNDEFLFRPTSITMDRYHNLYIYDNLQARIFKLDKEFNLLKAFGRKGGGPGEIGGTGGRHMVAIKMGRDDNLYVNDIRQSKVIVFNQQGEYLRDFKYKTGRIVTPSADAGGNVYMTAIKGPKLEIQNEKQVKMLSLPCARGNFDYLFYRPGPLYREWERRNPSAAILMALTGDSGLLIYYQNSSALTVVKEQRVMHRVKIWPQEALTVYKAELRDILKQDKEMFRKIFFKLFVDDDQEGIFYLQLGRNKKRHINALYRFNLKGELLEVLYVRLKPPHAFTRFELKQNGLFYALEDQKITIYKEEVQ